MHSKMVWLNTFTWNFRCDEHFCKSQKNQQSRIKNLWYQRKCLLISRIFPLHYILYSRSFLCKLSMEHTRRQSQYIIQVFTELFFLLNMIMNKLFANAISMNLDELGRSIFTAGQSHLDHLIFFRRTLGTCSHSDHLVFFRRTLGTWSHSHHLVFFRSTLGTWKKARWSEWDGPWRRPYTADKTRILYFVPCKGLLCNA